MSNFPGSVHFGRVYCSQIVNFNNFEKPIQSKINTIPKAAKACFPWVVRPIAPRRTSSNPKGKTAMRDDQVKHIFRNIVPTIETHYGKTVRGKVVG